MGPVNFITGLLTKKQLPEINYQLVIVSMQRQPGLLGDYTK